MAEVIIDRARDRLRQPRDVGKIAGIMVHRAGVNLVTGQVIGYDAESICDAFCGRDPQWLEVAQATGRQNPYTFFVGGSLGPEDLDGKVWQALTLDEIGHHARRFSCSYLGVCMIGDFRREPPSSRQWRAAVDLVGDLCLLLGVRTKYVHGHGEVPDAHGGDKAPGEPAACPGEYWPMDTFRDDLAVDMWGKVKQDAFWRLEQTGLLLP